MKQNKQMKKHTQEANKLEKTLRKTQDRSSQMAERLWKEVTKKVRVYVLL